MIRRAMAVAALIASTAVGAREPVDLHQAMDRLATEGKFSGAVVMRRGDTVLFARGYGYADPFTGRRFTPDTPVDSGSLAKPVTAAAILLLVGQGRIDLDASVESYLPEYPHPTATVRHLLAHSAALPQDTTLDPLGGKTNEAFLAEVGSRRLEPLFAPGSGFSYCNICYTTLAVLIERISGGSYLDFMRGRLHVGRDVILRPRRLADWTGRAIGYRRSPDGKILRADSFEDEIFYGSGNLSISAAQLARWGTEWWKSRLAPIRTIAMRPARIAGKSSGLTLGNWYCARAGRRCHYLGHHEGFHHMLYWDADRRISIAMVSNNQLAPALQQRLQRSLVAFAEGRRSAAGRELATPLSGTSILVGHYSLPTGERITIAGDRDALMSVERGGVRYPAYPVADGIRYVPGLDVYVSGQKDGLRWISLDEDFIGTRR